MQGQHLNDVKCAASEAKAPRAREAAPREKFGTAENMIRAGTKEQVDALRVEFVKSVAVDVLTGASR